MARGEQPEQQERLEPLHRNRDFRRLWIGQACSELGSGASTLAYPLLVLALTGSAVHAGIVGSANLAARAMLGLPAGALVDRWNRRRLMITCEVVRALAVAGLVLAILTGWASLPVIVAVAVVEGGAAVLFDPAQTAALRHIVPMVQLPIASARNEARSYGAGLAGPPLGGALFTLTRFAPFLADAISDLLSLVAVVGIRRPLQEQRAERAEPMWRAVGSGLRFVVREPFLRAMLGFAPLVNAAFEGILFVLVVVLRQRGVAPAAIGGVQSIILVGGLAGALIAPWLQARVRTPVLIIAFTWIISGLVAGTAGVLGTRDSGTYLVAALLALCLLATPSINAGLFGYQVAITPDAMQGRVDSAISLLAMGLQPLAPILGGVLVAAWGGPWAFAGFAAALVVAAIIATASRGIRKMRPLDDLPDRA